MLRKFWRLNSRRSRQTGVVLAFLAIISIVVYAQPTQAGITKELKKFFHSPVDRVDQLINGKSSNSGSSNQTPVVQPTVTPTINQTTQTTTNGQTQTSSGQTANTQSTSGGNNDNSAVSQPINQAPVATDSNQQSQSDQNIQAQQAAEQARIEAENRRQAEEQARLAAEQAERERLQNEQAAIAEAQRQAEEQARLAEEAAVRAAENIRLAEEAKQQAAVAAAAAEEKKKAEQAKIKAAEEAAKLAAKQAAEEQKKAEEAAKKAQQKKLAEEAANKQLIEEQNKKLAEEAAKLADDKKKQAEDYLDSVRENAQVAGYEASDKKEEVVKANEDLLRAKNDAKQAGEESEKIKKTAESIAATEDPNKINALAKKGGINIFISTTTSITDQDIEPLVGKAVMIDSSNASSAETKIDIVDVNKNQITTPSIRQKIVVEKVIPLAKQNEPVGLSVLPAVNKNKRASSAPAVVMIDSDVDGLSDDMEARLGTDPHKADTDGDGYGDWVEVKNGYNPLGKGKTGEQEDLKPLEKAIIDRVPLEQPKTSRVLASQSTSIDRIETSGGQVVLPGQESMDKAIAKDDNLRFSGIAAPNEVVALFIYSEMPIVVTAKTDYNGNWTYDLDKSLVNGQHEAYVVVMNEEGAIKYKSSPLAFFVQEARAATTDTANGQTVGKSGSNINPTVGWQGDSGLDWLEDFVVLYIIGCGLITLACLGLFLLVNRKNKDQNK